MLYGNDIDKTTNPIEAGLGWICKPEKGEFVGRNAIVEHEDKQAQAKTAVTGTQRKGDTTSRVFDFRRRRKRRAGDIRLL